jgi:hypothetical protein
MRPSAGAPRKRGDNPVLVVLRLRPGGVSCHHPNHLFTRASSGPQRRKAERDIVLLNPQFCSRLGGFVRQSSDKETSVLRGGVVVPYITLEWAAKASWAMPRITSRSDDGTLARARSTPSGSASYMIMPNARGTDSGFSRPSNHLVSVFSLLPFVGRVNAWPVHRDNTRRKVLGHSSNDVDVVSKRRR